MSKAARRARKHENRDRARDARPDDHESDYKATCASLFALLGPRNVILARLAEHLTAEEKHELGWPRSKTNTL